jgi:hypothetical protein
MKSDYAYSWRRNVIYKPSSMPVEMAVAYRSVLIYNIYKGYSCDRKEQKEKRGSRLGELHPQFES